MPVGDVEAVGVAAEVELEWAVALEWAAVALEWAAVALEWAAVALVLRRDGLLRSVDPQLRLEGPDLQEVFLDPQLPADQVAHVLLLGQA